MFRKAIYTCVGLVAVLTICGLIWEFAYWRPRQPKEAKTEFFVANLTSPKSDLVFGFVVSLRKSSKSRSYRKRPHLAVKMSFR